MDNTIDPKDIVVCFDSWYLTGELTSQLKELGVSWISKIKGNWKITAEVSQNSYPISQPGLWKNEFKVCGIKVKDFFKNILDSERVFRIWHSSLGVVYACHAEDISKKTHLVSNRNLKSQTLKAHYKCRWQIEVMFKTLKQVTQIGQTHFQVFLKNKAFMAFRVLVYLLLQTQKVKYRRYRKKTVGQLRQIFCDDIIKLFDRTHNALYYLQFNILNKSSRPLELIKQKLDAIPLKFQWFGHFLS